ncbi:MAG: zinc ribbon domain-containing protein [Candidatus Heimdallarchaeota archaeon]
MSKKKRGLNKYTWIVTELLIGLAALVYGLYATIKSLPDPNVTYIVITILGTVLLFIAIGQILLARRKKIKKHCSKCGEKIKKDDEFCAKCGKEIT